MFTGIVTALGTVQSIKPSGNDRDMCMTIATTWPDTGLMPLGSSVACSGCCLTVVGVSLNDFTVEVSAETLSRTVLGTWLIGTYVNLERSLRVGDELGGHWVSGHVDGVGLVVSKRPENGSIRCRVQIPKSLSKFISKKGSIAIDGVSFTVNDVDDNSFDINIISHTATVTTIGFMKPGDKVNVEVDMIARYVSRLLETK